MKRTTFLVIVLNSLLAQSTFLQAQKPTQENIRLISESEKQAHSSLHQPRESLIQNTYDLKYHRFYWYVDPAQPYIRGAVTSYFEVTHPFMTSIQFELSAGMSADSAYHKGFRYGVEHEGSVITVQFGEISPMGSIDSVTVFYHGNPTTTGFGSFGSEVHAGAPGMWTLSEPYGASDWWPSKNDLTDKIDSLDIYVVAPNGNSVASNGVLISEKPFGVNNTITHWQHRYPIASYLIAIATTNYARFSDYYVKGSDTLEIKNYVYPEDLLALRENAAGVLPSIALFEDLFQEYPFSREKYGQAQFGWGGGMEHQTMTFLGKGAFNHEIIAHELAHQWFGDMITCGSWQDIWLNEGFATYCAGLTYEHMFDGYYWPIWKYQSISYVCFLPDGSVFCNDTSSVGRIFDSRLSYSKGALLLHMLRWKCGDDNFFAGVRNYLNDPELRHGFARTADLKAHLEAASGLDLTEFFDDWFYGEGFPTYTVDAGQLPDHTTSVTIYQSQSHTSVDFFEMPVPVQFFGGGKDTIITFNHTFSGEMFTCNPGFTIDSVKFDPEMWLISASNTVTFGRNELPAEYSFSIQPVPANDFLYVNHNLTNLTGIQIFTLAGKHVHLQIDSQAEGKVVINTSALNAGMYLLKATSNEATIIRKFLVVR